MDISTTSLPSGGYGYKFPTVSVSPMSFLQITQYLENLPSDPLDKYLYDINNLVKEDPKISDCYVMDVDFLIFYKKLITVSADMSYKLKITCPDCGHVIEKTITLNSDIHFKQIDQTIMNGAVIELNGHKYDVVVPTLRNFKNVFDLYLRYKKISDLRMIKTIAMIGDFNLNGNQIENDVLGATHEDITLLLALRELYYDRVEPIDIYCPNCNSVEDDGNGGKRRKNLAVRVDSLIVDFFRELCNNSPIDASKILFK